MVALKRIFLIALAVALLMPAAAANAHSITPAITLPASPPVEDSGFAIGFTGDVSSLPNGDGELYARIRPAGGTPCAPTYRTDPGTQLLYFEDVTGSFSNVATYTPPAPGDYLVCAWLEDEPSDTGPPASAVVTVRPAVLQISAVAPQQVNVGVPFAVTVNYRSEVPRFLTVLVARASTCSVSSDAFRGTTTGAVEVANDLEASGSGTKTGTVSLDAPGSYLVCGFLEEEQFGSAAAEFVAPPVAIVVSRPAPRFKQCGYIGGRRNIRDVRARVVSCPSARSLARRWASRRRAPRRLGAYRCFVASRIVTCTAGSSQVKFTLGRR